MLCARTYGFSRLLGVGIKKHFTYWLVPKKINHEYTKRDEVQTFNVRDAAGTMCSKQRQYSYVYIKRASLIRVRPNTYVTTGSISNKINIINRRRVARVFCQLLVNLVSSPFRRAYNNTQRVTVATGATVQANKRTRTCVCDYTRIRRLTFFFLLSVTLYVSSQSARRIGRKKKRRLVRPKTRFPHSNKIQSKNFIIRQLLGTVQLVKNRLLGVSYLFEITPRNLITTTLRIIILFTARLIRVSNTTRTRHVYYIYHEIPNAAVWTQIGLSLLFFRSPSRRKI